MRLNTIVGKRAASPGSRRSRGRWPTPVDGHSLDRPECPQQRSTGGAERRDVGVGLPATNAAGARTKRSYVRDAADGGFEPAIGKPDARRADTNSPEQRVERAVAIVVNGANKTTVGTRPARPGDLLDLIVDDRALDMAEDRLGVLEHQPKRFRVGQLLGARQAAQRLPMDLAIFECRLDRNPNFHAKLPLTPRT